MDAKPLQSSGRQKQPCGSAVLRPRSTSSVVNVIQEIVYNISVRFHQSAAQAEALQFTLLRHNLTPLQLYGNPQDLLGTRKSSIKSTSFPTYFPFSLIGLRLSGGLYLHISTHWRLSEDFVVSVSVWTFLPQTTGVQAARRTPGGAGPCWSRLPVQQLEPCSAAAKAVLR